MDGLLLGGRRERSIDGVAGIERGVDDRVRLRDGVEPADVVLGVYGSMICTGSVNVPTVAGS